MQRRGAVSRDDAEVHGDGKGRWIRPLAVAILVLLALVPLVYVPGIVFPYVVPRALFLRLGTGLGAAILVWALGTRRLAAEDARDPILWSLAAFALAASLSSLLGAAPHWSFFGGYERMWGGIQWIYLLLLYVLLRTFVGDREWSLLLRVTLYVAAAVAAYAAAEFAVQGFVAVGVDATLGNRGYLGAYMILAGGAATVVAGRRDGALPRWLPAGMLALFLAVVVLTGRLSALIGATAGGAAALLLLAAGRLRRPGAAKKWLVGGVGAAAVAAVAAFLLFPEAAGRVPIVARVTELDLSGGTLAARLMAWEAGLDGAAARPLTGWGSENFHLVTDRHLDPAFYGIRPEHTLWDRAHNVVIGKLVQHGALGLAAYLAFWGSLLVLTVRGWRRDRLRATEAAGLLLAFVGYFVFLQFWFEDHSSALLLVTLAAYLRHRYADRPLFGSAGGTAPSRGRALAWGAAAGLLSLAVVWVNGTTALTARRLAQAEAADGLRGTVERFEQARRLDAPEGRQVALQYSLAMTNVGLRSGRQLRDSDSLRTLYSRGVEGADRALGLAADRNPWDGRLDARRGRLASGAAMVFAGDGIRRMARESLRRAIEKSPPLIEHRHALAEVEALFGDLPAARGALREALDVYDGYGRTYHLLARMQGGGPDPAVLSRLRQSFWLGYHPDGDGFGFLRRTLEELVRRGEADRAERLMTEYFASRYLPALRKRGDPFASERRAFLEGLAAETESSSGEFRTYEIPNRDLPLVARWPRIAAAAGDCDRAELAMRLIVNGLSEAHRTARLRPTLLGQLRELRRRCPADGGQTPGPR